MEPVICNDLKCDILKKILNLGSLVCNLVTDLSQGYLHILFLLEMSSSTYIFASPFDLASLEAAQTAPVTTSFINIVLLAAFPASRHGQQLFSDCFITVPIQNQ
jgi:hypothetical protein